MVQRSWKQGWFRGEAGSSLSVQAGLLSNQNQKKTVCLKARKELQINISGKTFCKTHTLALFTVMLIRSALKCFLTGNSTELNCRWPRPHGCRFLPKLKAIPDSSPWWRRTRAGTGWPTELQLLLQRSYAMPRYFRC